ncbi:MAG: UxaA family hydrolase, partial [Rhabdaerophilum sp.]
MNAPVPPPLAPRSLRLHASDNVVIAVDALPEGQMIEGVRVKARIPRGHKLAVKGIAPGEAVLKFGQIIGFASAPIEPGDWIHEHNCAFAAFARDYRHAEDGRAPDILPLEAQATFQGYRRANGTVGTRNYVGILTSVNCSASVAKFIAEEINRSGLLRDFPNIDGVIPLVHSTGCGIAEKGEAVDVLKRTTFGYAANPNMGASILVGLGCEAFQIGKFKEA